MKKQVYHILNGDALAARFPATIAGEKIICRECLCEGPVTAGEITAFYTSRENYLSATYPEIDHVNYVKDVEGEFRKIDKLPQDAQVYLWFEQDVFCQVNLWFTLNLLEKKSSEYDIFLVLTDQRSPYGFSGYSNNELQSLYEHSIPISYLSHWSKLWNAYVTKDKDLLFETGNRMAEVYPFLPETIRAVIDSMPYDNMVSRPLQTMQTIIADLNNDDFRQIFREFCRREAIYGYGDLQVMRLYDTIISSS